jgi:hypothetical protein
MHLPLLKIQPSKEAQSYSFDGVGWQDKQSRTYKYVNDF